MLHALLATIGTVAIFASLAAKVFALHKEYPSAQPDAEEMPAAGSGHGMRDRRHRFFLGGADGPRRRTMRRHRPSNA
jgi:hypothetical protein